MKDARDPYIMGRPISTPIIVAAVLIGSGLIVWAGVHYHDRTNPPPRKVSEPLPVEVYQNYMLRCFTFEPGTLKKTLTFESKQVSDINQIHSDYHNQNWEIHTGGKYKQRQGELCGVFLVISK